MKPRLIFMGLFTVGLVFVLLTGGAQASKTTTHFIRQAMIGNQFEISSSRLALQNSHNDEVKSFAQKMIDDHTQIGNRLHSVLASTNPDTTQPMPHLDPKHQNLLNKLNAAEGNAFDRKYIKAQIEAHDDAVVLFQNYAQDGDDDALRNFANETLPKLQEHQQHVKELKASR